MNARPGIEVASLTDIGRQRGNNEDSYLYWEPASDEEFERKGRLAIVADGMGGYEGGLEASRLAVQTVREVYDQAFRDTPQAALLAAFSAAHERIQNYAEQHPQFYGMGTTCTAFVLRGLSDVRHMRMAAKVFAQGSSQNAHPGAMDDADTRQSSKKGLIEIAFDLPLRLVRGTSDDVDLRGKIIRIL